MHNSNGDEDPDGGQDEDRVDGGRVQDEDDLAGDRDEVQAEGRDEVRDGGQADEAWFSLERDQWR